MSDPKPPKFISVKEFAERHAISEWLVEQACKTNELPHARLGKRILIPEDALVIQVEGRGWKRAKGNAAADASAGREALH